MVFYYYYYYFGTHCTQYYYFFYDTFLCTNVESSPPCHPTIFFEPHSTSMFFFYFVDFSLFFCYFVHSRNAKIHTKKKHKILSEFMKASMLMVQVLFNNTECSEFQLSKVVNRNKWVFGKVSPFSSSSSYFQPRNWCCQYVQQFQTSTKTYKNHRHKYPCCL